MHFTVIFSEEVTLNLFYLWWSFNGQCYLERKINTIFSKDLHFNNGFWNDQVPLWKALYKYICWFAGVQTTDSSKINWIWSSPFRCLMVKIGQLRCSNCAQKKLNPFSHLKDSRAFSVGLSHWCMVECWSLILITIYTWITYTNNLLIAFSLLFSVLKTTIKP